MSALKRGPGLGLAGVRAGPPHKPAPAPCTWWDGRELRWGHRVKSQPLPLLDGCSDAGTCHVGPSLCHTQGRSSRKGSLRGPLRNGRRPIPFESWPSAPLASVLTPSPEPEPEELQDQSEHVTVVLQLRVVLDQEHPSLTLQRDALLGTSQRPRGSGSGFPVIAAPPRPRPHPVSPPCPLLHRRHRAHATPSPALSLGPKHPSSSPSGSPILSRGPRHRALPPTFHTLPSVSLPRTSGTTFSPSFGPL